jgi:hypothetical protein
VAERDPRLKSKWWRLTHLYKIKDKDGSLVLFKPNVVQLAIIASLYLWRRARFLKYRQGGITTLFCLLYLDDALWTPGFSAAIISHDREHLDKIFQIIERAYDNMPKSLRATTRQDTLRMMRFERAYDGTPLDSSIYVAMKLRGGTVQALHISERAYIVGNASIELEAGSKQSVPIKGRISEETTANGFNEFYDGFTSEADPRVPEYLQYHNFFYAWHEHPEYTLPGKLEEYADDDLELKRVVRDAYNGKELTDGQIIWYRWKMAELLAAARASDDKISLDGAQLMRQEYPSTIMEAFQSGLGNVFDLQLLATYQAQKPLELYTTKGKIKGEKVAIWHKPVAGKQYFMGCDPSDGGAGGDPAGFSVWDEDYKQCAQWRGHLRPDKIAEILAEVGHMYNEAFIGVENNMLSCILFLSQIYDNYFITVTVDEKRDRRTKKIGFTTSTKTRDIMIDDFNMHFEEESLEINSGITLKEMQTFVKKEGGKREHADGKTDDTLFGDFIAIQMIKHKDRSRGRKRTFAGKPAGL